jgi:hypothetical protein
MVQCAHMGKAMNDRAMRAAEPGEEQDFFFPKANPPVTIRAKTLQEAQAKLEALNKKEA